MNGLIIANGVLPPFHIIRSLHSSCDIVVCADGGANHAKRLRITPDIILGDLDSITSATKKYFSAIPILHITDQNSTDLEKAITFCIQRNITTANVVGALGKRIDHATNSLGCFKRFRNAILLRMYDVNGLLTLIDKSADIPTRNGQKISLIPLDRCIGVTTKHLKYELKNSTLELGAREGISNEATSSSVSISVKKGTLLLYQCY